MNIGELLGAGLLGGVGNAAKGAGDRLREEAKQKREMALLNEQQENAIALQGAASQDAIDLAKAKGEIKKEVDTNQGEVTIDVESAGSQNNQNEQDNAGEIASALASLNGALAIERDSLSIQAKGKLNTATAALQAQYDLGSQANAAALLAAQKKVDAIVAANVASQLAGTQAAAATALAGTQKKMAVYNTATNKDVAAALAAAQAKTAAKLSETRMAEIKENNAAAIENIKIAKVNDVQPFYNMTTGTEQMHVLDSDGNWKPKGGPKIRAAASKGSYTFENVVIDGEKVTGYMKGDEFVVVGTPVDDDTKDSSSWDAEKVTKFANKQAWLQMGASLDKYGEPTGNIGPKERAKVAKDTATIVKLWKANKSLDLAGVMDDVFSGKTTGKTTGGSTGGSTGGLTNEAADLIRAQNAINGGAPFDDVVKSLKTQYPNINTSGLKKK